MVRQQARLEKHHSNERRCLSLRCWPSRRVLCLSLSRASPPARPSSAMMKAAGSCVFVWTGRGDSLHATYATDALSDAEYSKAAKTMQVCASGTQAGWRLSRSHCGCVL